MGRPMGIGKIGGADIIIKRKNRWTLTLQSPCGVDIPEHACKLASRPNLSIEETELNFLHGKKWLPGKGTWESITVTYVDVANDNGWMNPLWSWLTSVYDFTDPVNLWQSSKRGTAAGTNGNAGGYAGVATLIMYDGCGNPLETWTLGDVFPTAINFGDLDYSSSEEATIELTLRYSEVAFVQNCGTPFTKCGCAGC